MMYSDTGVPINPGKGGVDCLCDGEHFDEKGELIDCFCGECKYYLNCFGDEVLDYFRQKIEERTPEIPKKP